MVCVLGLVWYGYTHYQVYTKFELLKDELNQMRYVVEYDVVGAGFELRQTASNPIPGLLEKLNECGYSQNLPGLIQAMDYQVPGYTPFDTEGTKLAANRAILKGLIAPIAKGRKIYVNRAGDGQWVGIGHWVNEKWYEYRVDNATIVMVIREKR